MPIDRRTALRTAGLALPALVATGAGARAADRVFRVGYQKASVALTLLKLRGFWSSGWRPSATA